MPKKLISKQIQRKFNKIIQQVVADLSESLIVVQESPMFVDCPNCLWDSINKKSSNVFDSSFVAATTIFVGTDQERTINPVSFTLGRCPVCLGEGQLFTTSEVCIPALINFVTPGARNGPIYQELPAGKEGSVVVTVKTHACFYDLLTSNNIFVVHGNIKCEKFMPPIVRGMGGEEALVEMWLLTSESGERVTGTAGRPPVGRTEDPRRRIKGPTDLQVLRGIQKGRNS